MLITSHQCRLEHLGPLLVTQTQLSIGAITPSDHRAVCYGADCVIAACCDVHHLFALRRCNQRWHQPGFCVAHTQLSVVAVPTRKHQTICSHEDGVRKK